jgi:ABC-type sugar transport system substrate-binding protein
MSSPTGLPYYKRLPYNTNGRYLEREPTMKKSLFVALGIGCIIALTIPALRDKGKTRVGFLVLDLTNPYWNSQAKGALAKAKEYNMKLIVYDGQSDPAREIDALENWITQGISGIIISAIDSKGCQAYVKRAKQKGIPVVAAMHPLEGADARLCLDEYQFGFKAGIEAGKWITEKLNGQAEVAILAADDLKHIVDRADGIRDGILKMAPNAKLVARQDAYVPDKGMAVTEAILQAHPNIKVIQGINDSGVLGAYEAVRAAGKDSPDFYIGGNDATLEALEKIKEGGIYRCSVSIDPYGSGQHEVEMLYNLLEDIEFERKQFVSMTPVTMENVDEFLGRYRARGK